jgi:hypothetical protein
MSEEQNRLKTMADELDGLMDRLPVHDLRGIPAEQALASLQRLIEVLESSLKIIKGRHYKAVPEPEPFPGAVGKTLDQSLAAIALARKSGLLP